MGATKKLYEQLCCIEGHCDQIQQRLQYIKDTESRVLFEEERKKNPENPVWNIIDELTNQYDIKPEDVNENLDL